MYNVLMPAVREELHAKQFLYVQYIHNLASFQFKTVCFLRTILELVWPHWYRLLCKMNIHFMYVM